MTQTQRPALTSTEAHHAFESCRRAELSYMRGQFQAEAHGQYDEARRMNEWRWIYVNGMTRAAAFHDPATCEVCPKGGLGDLLRHELAR